jgi:ubiquinone/menaquinone biosynthesis C-methylase UbiE
MWRIWHKLLIRFDKDSTVNFMNYGFAGLNGDKPIQLEPNDEINRYCIQLYNHVVDAVDIKDKKVVEIGSGRGGGASFITRYHKPAQYTGVDISSGVIDFCNRFYKVPGLKFKVGKAEKIPLDDSSHDVVVNVESARCYSNLETFFNEVHRVLQPNGHFLFADMIEKEEVQDIREKLNRCGFKIQSETDITPNVANGLALDSERRETLIDNQIPGFLQKQFKVFAGTKGTSRFDSFNNGKFDYRSFVITKQ